MTKRVMVAGPTGSGKTTLLKALNLWERSVRKTEAISFAPQAVDTPGEFYDIPNFYHALIQTSVKASVILLLMDPVKAPRAVPNFSTALRAPVIGVVTKTDQASPEAVETAERALKTTGVSEVFRVSAVTGAGIEALAERLKQFQEKTPTL